MACPVFRRSEETSPPLTPPASGRGSYLLHPALGAFSSRASGMISRIRAQKCLRHTSLSLSGPMLKLFDCRSEEHTSELQSLMRISYAVFCLKKKNPQLNNGVLKNRQDEVALATSSITWDCRARSDVVNLTHQSSSYVRGDI